MKIFKVSFLTIILAMSFGLGVEASASETVKGAKQDFAVFKKEMNEKLDSVEKQLEELRTKAKASGSKAQDKAIKELEETQAQLKDELNSLKDDTKRNWKEIKKNISSSLESLHAKIQKKLQD